MSRNVIKAGILLAILVVPASLFLFVTLFGDNKFDLPYFFPALDESGKIVMVDGDTVFHQVPNFELVNQLGDTVHLSDFGTDFKVASFFFSRCGTICPILNRNLKRVVDSFTEQDKVYFLSITVDPEYDSSEKLRDYVQSNGFNISYWNFLTGDKSYIYNVAIKGFKLPVADASEYDSSIIHIDEQFIHSEKVLLLDDKNHVRGIYDGVNKEDMERLRVEIKVLLDSREKN
jgi:protein SCO1/2